MAAAERQACGEYNHNDGEWRWSASRQIQISLDRAMFLNVNLLTSGSTSNRGWAIQGIRFHFVIESLTLTPSTTREAAGRTLTKVISAKVFRASKPAHRAYYSPGIANPKNCNTTCTLQTPNLSPRTRH